MKRFIHIIIITLFVFVLSMGSGCKKFVDPGLIVEDYKGDTTGKTVITNVDTTYRYRRVMLINIEGLSAQVFFDSAVIKNFSFVQSLLTNSKFGKMTVTPKRNNTLSWASMLTGNTDTRIFDTTFYARPVDSTNTIPVPLNINVIKYIHDFDTARKVGVFSTWGPLVNSFLRHADIKQVTSSDAETKDAVISSLTGNRIDLVIASLNTLRINNFSLPDTNRTVVSDSYKNAAKQVDMYVQQIYNAINARSLQSKENWLTIITSTEVANSIPTQTSITPIIIMNNKKFIGQNVNTLVPSIQPKHEDVAANILYWLGVAKPTMTMNNGVEWLNRFSVEF